MQYTVYADMLFLVNWLMDYALLWAVSVILQIKTTKKRLALAAAIGAVWVCLIAVIHLPAFAENILSLAIVSSLMILTAFRPKNVKVILKELIILYGIAILGGGMVNLLYFHTGVGGYLRGLLWGNAEQKNGSAAVVFVSAAAVGTAVWLMRQIVDFRSRQRALYTVTLFLGEDSAALKGLLDTGNRLREPISGKAVHIAEKRALESLKPDREGAFKFLVPYHAVGTENGLLVALRVDRMELISADGYRIAIEKPLIGLYDGRLSTENEYQIILHTEIETRQGETL